MKTKILNLGTVINKTAQKQINGGTQVTCLPSQFFIYYCPPLPYTNCYCKQRYVGAYEDYMKWTPTI